jgi:hypothetical protein
MLRKPDISTELVMGLLAVTSSTNSFFHAITLAEKAHLTFYHRLFVQFGPLCPFLMQPSEMYARQHGIWGFHSNEHSFCGLPGYGHKPLMIHNVMIGPKDHNRTAGHSLIPCIQLTKQHQIWPLWFLYFFLGGRWCWVMK